MAVSAYIALALAANDDLQQKRMIRSQSGNTSSTRANPKTYPSLENYTAIWNFFAAEHDALAAVSAASPSASN
jgi:hypothetical protein